jgi:phthalate 4,5-dioxygenase oxygenase subunit
MALTAAQQEFLTRVGPGTPMGNYFRRYWIPILLAEELAKPDGSQVPVTILGEDLIAFRDSNGDLGLLERYCAHRRASLFFARNEEGGLRCAYHGWKFDKSGSCVDMPSEPEDSRFASKVRIQSYPCVEHGGLIMAYMGPPELKPPLPAYEWLTVPETHRYADKRIQQCNYLQVLEGALDSSHVTFLHRYELDHDETSKGTVGTRMLRDYSHPRFDVRPAPWGLAYAAIRDVAPDTEYWRMTPYIAPWYTIVPPFDDRPQAVHSFVPIDDEHTWCISWYYCPSRPINEQEQAFYKGGGGIHSKNIPGSYNPVANESNNYLIDRQAQKERRSFSGVPGIVEADMALQESMGRVTDRTRERLGKSDTAIIQARQLLMHCAENQDSDSELPGLQPEQQLARSAALIISAADRDNINLLDVMAVRPGQPFVFATENTEF